MIAIILAGGKASRMGGRAKAFLKIGKGTLINTQLSSLRKIFKKIIIVTNSLQRYRKLKGIKLVSDIIPGNGPLGGIYSGLIASSSFYNFVIACDMPFINSGLIKYMYKNTQGYDVVVPRINKQYEPLFCIYSKNCLNYIRRILDKKIFKISRFFPQVLVREISEKEILRFGNPQKIFMNINTREDLLKLNG